MKETSHLDQIKRDHQSEKASNSYLMSMIAIMVGLPMPIFNLIATLIFYGANRKEGFFVRWHCTQALFSQIILLLFNAPAFIWFFSIVFGDNEFNNNFFAYIIVVFIINLLEFIATIITAIETRKGRHIEWPIVGPLTNSVVKKSEESENIIQ